MKPADTLVSLIHEERKEEEEEEAILNKKKFFKQLLILSSRNFFGLNYGYIRADCRHC